MQDLLQETWQIARSITRRPLFAILAILTLALGIALNVSVFAVLNARIFHALGYKDPDRLAILWATAPRKSLDRDWTSYPTLMDWKSASRSFEAFAVHLRIATATVQRDEPVRLKAGRVSASLFPLLGIRPLLGRTYTVEEEDRREPLAVLSESYWRSEFGSNPDIIGRKLVIDSQPATVIGVMPAAFAFPESTTQIWLPLTFVAQWPAFLEARQSDGFRAIVRLKPGISLARAQSELDTIAHDLEQRYPATDKGKGIKIVPLSDDAIPASTRGSLWMIMAAVFLLLLVACGNVGSLFLARTLTQRHELSLRVALGASTARLLRYKLTEAALISTCGASAALLITPAILQFLSKYDATPVRIDRPAFFFAAGLGLLTTLLAGIFPAWISSRLDPINVIRNSAHTIRGQSRPLLMRILTTAQFGMTALLTITATVLLFSYWKLSQVSLGFDPHNVVAASIELPNWFSGGVTNAASYFDEAIANAARQPGIEKAAAISNVLAGRVSNNRILLEQPAAGWNETESTLQALIAGDYFAVMRIPLLKGRVFNPHDDTQAARVAIINRPMAGRFWPNQDPLGRRFRFGVPGQQPEPWLTVVGIVADTHPNGAESELTPQFYMPLAQRPWFGSMEIVARVQSPNAQTIDLLRRSIRKVNSSVPAFKITTLEEQLDRLGTRRAASTWILGLFSILAILLAAIGLYALVHYSVSRRVGEIGVRTALGASPLMILGMIVGEALTLAALGIAIGTLAAIALAHTLQTFAYGVQATDPAVLSFAVLVLLIVSLAACLAPAMTASRLTPAHAFQTD